ncbi:hypothetical protein ACLOJK_036057 [Asimina triloba]
MEIIMSIRPSWGRRVVWTAVRCLGTRYLLHDWMTGDDFSCLSYIGCRETMSDGLHGGPPFGPRTCGLRGFYVQLVAEALERTLQEKTTINAKRNSNG